MAEIHEAIPVCTLPKTIIFGPGNGWLEDDRFLLGFGPFSGAILVKGSLDEKLPSYELLKMLKIQ